MRLPKSISRRITDYVDSEAFSHQQACWDSNEDPGDVDPLNELPWTLNICFPEHLEADGLRSYRTIDWAELQGTVWGPIRKKLHLCKVGWHSWSMGYRISTFSIYYCSDCRKQTKRVPRWAR